MKNAIALLALLFFFLTKPHCQVNLNSGLIAYYPFNSNANDASGNGLNGTVQNGAQLTTDRFGNPNNAYQFDGVDDVILVHDNGELSPPSLSIAYYFSSESAAHQICIGKINYTDGNGATYNSGLNVNGASNTWFNLSSPTSSCFVQIPGTEFFPTIASPSISLNEWHCIVNTFANGNEKIYLDGILVSNETLPFATSKFCTNTDFLIGSWWSGDLRPFKGKIDEVRMYNRVLSQEEVSALCNLQTTDPCGIAEDFTFKQNICDPLSVEFLSTANIGSIDEIKWDFGDGHLLSGNVNPTNIYSSEGNYDVEMIVVKGTCSDTIRKKITVVTSLEDIISTKDTTLCYGNSLKILAKPALNFCWSPSTFLDNPSLQNPTTSTPQNITYYLTAEVAGTNLITNGDFSSGNTGFTSAYNFTNVNITEGEYSVGTNPQTWNSSLSSCKDHTSGVGKMLLVNGSPAADVNVWKQTITVLPNTNYAFSTWIQALWDPNPAQLQFSINGKPLGSQITASLPTCSWSQFYTTWNSGNNTTAEISIVNKNTQIQGNDFALDDISFAPVSIKKDSIKINVETPFVKTGNDTLVCANSPVPLFAVGSLNYVWNPANGLNNPSTANPTAVTSTSTQYIVTGTSANGCTAKDTVNVSVIPAPVINKSADIAICKNSSTQLFVSGGISYSWSPQTGLDNSFISNPVASPASSSTYVVTVTDVNNCTNKDSIKVTIRPDPVFSVNENENICSGGSINLKATGGNQYSWQPQESLDNPFIPAPSATPANTTNYSVLIKDTVCGGSATLATTITVLPAPFVKANKSNDIDCSVGSSQLIATGAVQYEWSPAASLSNTGIANPVATPVTPTEYVVKGSNNSGCSSIDSVLVDVKAINKGKFLMPSAFTPNNDGHNDCYGAKYWGFITEFDFSIFNRWGECVFHTKNPSQCWDGFYKGVPQNADVYVYIIKAKSFCESSVFRKGTVALIR